MVERAVAAIRAGEPVILPTDTVYGLCVAPGRADVLARLKGRPGGAPVALLAPAVDALLELVPELPEAVLLALLPGPFTLVLPNPARRLGALGGEATIGVRVPLLPEVSRSILVAAGPVAATSANLHGGPDPQLLDDVPAAVRAACAAAVDGGRLPGVPSTVLDLTGERPRVLREGAVPAAEALARLSAASA